jgi:hypothetical protein
MNKKRRKAIETLPRNNLSWIQMAVEPDTPYTQIKGRYEVCGRRGEKDKPCDILERAGS